ncbi:hypothetical protein Salat_0647400 [Sesamum alatum]|uniref:Uncharacterized protein n=1 Tax=Sesamum alatum TaxID=300844 RepID=A0AAE1YR64_9LAMI|nr:hypothetical protein Salat_0647400 [Sesamum alatum]
MGAFPGSNSSRSRTSSFTASAARKKKSWVLCVIINPEAQTDSNVAILTSLTTEDTGELSFYNMDSEVNLYCCWRVLCHCRPLRFCRFVLGFRFLGFGFAGGTLIGPSETSAPKVHF